METPEQIAEAIASHIGRLRHNMVVEIQEIPPQWYNHGDWQYQCLMVSAPSAKSFVRWKVRSTIAPDVAADLRRRIQSVRRY